MFCHAVTWELILEAPKWTKVGIFRIMVGLKLDKSGGLKKIVKVGGYTHPNA